MGNLLEKVLSDVNLIEATQKVLENKGAPGIDGMNVHEGQAFLYKHREEIKNAIRTRTYKPSPVKRVEIPKPDGGIRNLGIPTVKDRVIQQAINQVLTTIFENLIIDNRCWRFIKYYKKIFS